MLEIGFAQGHTRRATIDDTADGRPMALAKTGDGKKFSYGVSGHII
jgi:hypothetical protein